MASNLGALLPKYEGTLLGVAVGDALGAPFEAEARAPGDAIDRFLAEPVWWRYTDDTRMTIDLGTSLVRVGHFDAADTASRFAVGYWEEPWRGYGAGTIKVLRAIRSGAAWNQPAASLHQGRGSFGNGAAMRVAPLALFAFPDLDLIADLARKSARITHTHELGVEGAVLQATAIGWLLGRGSNDRLEPSRMLTDLAALQRSTNLGERLGRVETLLPHAAIADVITSLGNGFDALGSVPTAIWAFLRHPDSFRDLVRTAIALGGDTDTIASMAGALAGAYCGVTAIPTDWCQRVEGAVSLKRLASELHSLNVRTQSGSTARVAYRT